MLKEYFDLLVVVPLEEELHQVMGVFPGTENRSTSTEFRYVVDSGVSAIKILLVQQDGMGKTNAYKATASALDNFDVGIVICIGIAGSLSADIGLGDVCYSGSVIDVYENSKASDKDGHISLEFSPTHYDTPKEITTALNFTRILPDFKTKYEAWQREREEFAHQALDIPVISRKHQIERIGLPNTRNGAIACGSVSKSDIYNQKLRALDRKVLAIETESGGVFEAAAARGIPGLTIRGISDYADERKSELELGTFGAVRRIAAANAASFLRLQMSNLDFLSVLSSRREALNRVVAISPVPVESHNGLLSFLRKLGEEVDGKLRELSPEFRLQPKGYRLPIPRVREVDFSSSIGLSSEADPIDVRDAIRGRRVLLITIPRSYPDQSLSWVLADDLLTTELDGKQVIPVVVNGETLSPPNSGLRHVVAQHIMLDDILGAATQWIFLIDNIPLQSRNRLNFLVAQMAQYPEAKFIFITRTETNVLRESDFITRTSATLYKVCDISFSEIAYFIQKNFQMTGSEAEVIALRLRDTFSQFRLSAHPTYFAGIPRETLSALLQANRRAELIQLAVDGFLTFVVADDPADVTLSRTTRSRFLRNLVVALRVEKQSFDQEKLLAFTRAFSAEYDFDIDPMEFIHSFVEKGILFFDSDKVHFSLPFIESYLTALELKSRDDLAIKYFSIDSPDFDLQSFDLYAELGASEALVDRVTKNLADKLSELSTERPDSYILLGQELQPSILKRPSQLLVLQDALKSAMEEARSNSGDKERKQHLLDIADRIKETAAKRSEEEGQKAPHGSLSREAQLISLIQAWIVGSVLLGSGAEHLNANTKRTLVNRLVQLATLIIDIWTRVYVAVDFQKIKAELTSESAIASIIHSNDGQIDLKESRQLVNNLADFLEFSFLSLPFRRIVHQLCEQARHRVLATSVEKANVSGEMESIIHAAWLADIDGQRGRALLKNALRELPTAPFFRFVLASHFVMRVYWSHWRQEDRLALLEAADETIKPLSIQFKKPELKRFISKSKKPRAPSAKL